MALIRCPKCNRLISNQAIDPDSRMVVCPHCGYPGSRHVQMINQQAFFDDILTLREKELERPAGDVVNRTIRYSRELNPYEAQGSMAKEGYADATRTERSRLIEEYDEVTLDSIHSLRKMILASDLTTLKDTKDMVIESGVQQIKPYHLSEFPKEVIKHLFELKKLQEAVMACGFNIYELEQLKKAIVRGSL